MSDDKTPLDKAVELFVYAPVGVAMTARDMLPGFIERGRSQITNQLTMVRMVGQFAVQQGQTEAEKAFGRARKQALTTLEQLGGLGGTNGAGAHSTPTAAASPPAPTSSTPAPPTPVARSGPAAANLAIPDYDSLSASQVVPRLSSLGGDELEAVRVYEAAHRGRKTILNKIAQLQQA